MAVDAPAEARAEPKLRLAVADREKAVDRGRLGLLAVGHAVTDSYAYSLLAPTFPDIARRLGLSGEQVGAVPLMMGLSASLAQPLFGLITDRRPRWPLVAIGPLAAALLIGFVGRARGFTELALLLFLAGLGIGAFHPQGAMLARIAGRGSGLAMSAFTVGGNLGFGLAPILGPIYLALFGWEWFCLSAIPALLFFLVMLAAFRGYSPAGRLRARDGTAACGPTRHLALAALTATVVVRSFVQIGMSTFLPFLAETRFAPADQPAAKSLGVSAFLLAGAAAGPLGGYLSDRCGRRLVIAWSFLLAPWPLLTAFQLPGGLLIGALAFGAFILMLPHPANVVYAQELMPRSAGIAASMITGLAWGLAQIGAVPLGALVDATSPGFALQCLALVPLGGCLFVLALPGDAPVRMPR